MAFNIEEYISRRVREMIGQNWSDHNIIQQLSGLEKRKLVVEEIARQRKLAA